MEEEGDRPIEKKKGRLADGWKKINRWREGEKVLGKKIIIF